MHLIEIESLIHNVMLRLYPMRDGKTRTLLVQLPSHPLYVSADLTTLSNAIVELIDSSAEGSADGARIHVSVEHEGEKTVLRARESRTLRERTLHLIATSAPLAAGMPPGR